MDKSPTLPKRPKKPWDVLSEDLRALYETMAIENRYVHTKDQGWVLRPEHNILDNIGITLVDYILDDRGYFTALCHDFSTIGFSVAYLVDIYQDEGLLSEEGCWLGYLTYQYGDDLTLRSFKPSKSLLEKKIIRECSQEDLDTLYSWFVEGKLSYFTRKFGSEYEYGNSLDPEKLAKSPYLNSSDKFIPS